MKKKIPRNAPCPCDSGKKYKKCCYDKDFIWVQDEKGNIYKQVSMSQELDEVFLGQRQAFMEKHGREPGPDDYIFFEAPPLEHVEHETVNAMKRAKINPALIYAYEKTGRLVTEENKKLIPDEDLEEWEAAIDEYYELHDTED